MSYRRGEIVFLRCRVQHDYRGGPPERPRIDATAEPGHADHDEPDPLLGSSVVVVETCGPSGKVDDASLIHHVDARHLVSVDEARKAIQTRGQR